MRTEYISEKSVRDKYERLTGLLIERKLTITTMESCTAGQIISLITDTEGSSAVVKGAFVTYCNEAKLRQGVPAAVIKRYGVYSEETARAMADACRGAYRADIGIGITGTFGNTDLDNRDSIPGEVYFAVSTAHGTQSSHCSVPAQPSRSAYKLYMADVVVSKLFEILDAPAQCQGKVTSP
ncbi:MAG: CinA family protein [Lachnospiraceae bacterium]|nr:CinA family protein [Lachnospiraceae bacterium]